MQAEKESFEAQKDVLLFQLQELDQMKLEIGELEAIQEELETLKHFDKIANGSG